MGTETTTEREMPTWQQVRRLVGLCAEANCEWAGYPLPIDAAEIQVEPRHPLAAKLNGATLAKQSPEEEDGARIVNSWRHGRSGVKVVVWREPDGRTGWGYCGHGSGRRLDLWVRTLGVASSPAWDLDAEIVAMGKLGTLITERARQCYLLASCFLETSKRSGVTYLFRKLRPTVALRADEGGMRFLAALCLHPVAYYRDTWAGSHVPTDDVIAHLLLMRADERRFWAKANQHGMDDPEAGI